MTVENLEINVKTNVTKDTANKITSLANALGQLEAKASALTGLSHLSELANAMAAISGANVRASAFSGLAKGIENLSSALKTITNNNIANLTQLTTALKGLNNVNLAGLGNASSVSRAASSLHETAKGIDKVAESAKKAESPLSNFIGSLKRIAFYRIVRTIIKEITEAFKEGLENAYEWSKATGGELAPALDRIASASQKMKNQMGAAFGELLITLEPLILAIIELVTHLAEAITWLIATVSGRDSYMVANDVAKSWKEADKAAGDYKRTILGFDVINRLNGPSGGNGGDNGGDFGASSGFKNTKLPDLKPFWFPFITGGGIALKVLQEVIDKVVELLGMSPAMVAIGAETMPSFDEMLNQLRELLGKSPYTAKVFLDIASPAPQLEAVRVSVEMLLHNVEMGFAKATQSVKVSLAELASAVQMQYAFVTSIILTALSLAGAKAAEQWEKMTNKAREGATSVWQTVTEKYNQVRVTIGDRLSVARQNVFAFVRETSRSVALWGSNVAANTQAAFVNIATNVYLGLQNAGENIASFINTTASNIWSWATNTATNIVQWANSVAQSIGDALASAWESFKGFMQATGQAISGWWSQNKTWFVPVAIGAAVTVGAIVLAPATGGASLGALAFAANGGAFPNTGSLFVAGEAGPEIVANMGSSTGVMNIDQMRDAVREGAYDAITAALTGRDKANNIHVYLDSREIKTGQMRLARAGGV